MTANFRLKAYQIYFDEISFNKIEKEFIPLDNRNSPRPDWFEFHVIRGFLKSAKLKKNSYYGFLSPRFREKTGLSGKDVHDIFNKAQGSADAILLTSQPEQIALHKNPFLQGEFYHPGLIAATEHFFDYIGRPVDLRKNVTNLQKSVFSNYIIATSNFWEEWLELADLFYSFVEQELYHDDYNMKALYPYRAGHVELKVFVQERLVNYLLLNSKYKTFVPDHSRNLSAVEPVSFRKPLLEMEELKTKFIETGDPAFLSEYESKQDLFWRSLQS
jgi:hypothetical protein